MAASHMISAGGLLTSIHRLCVDRQLVSRSTPLGLANVASLNRAGHSIQSKWGQSTACAIMPLVGCVQTKKFPHTPVCS